MVVSADTSGVAKPYRFATLQAADSFINDLMNATGLVFDRQGMLYVSSRYDGQIFQITPNGNMSVFVVTRTVLDVSVGANVSVPDFAV